MTRDDIIRMAREAGGYATNFNGRWMFYMANVERFAALVAAAEREACANIVESNSVDREDEYICSKILAAILERGK